jgi:hypothetical protein
MAMVSRAHEGIPQAISELSPHRPVMVIKKIRTPLRVETLSFEEAAGFIPQR